MHPISTRIFLGLIAFVIFCSSPLLAATEQRKELVIGNKAYSSRPPSNPTNEATDAPEISVQLGHTAAIDAVAFSPDGKYMASGGNDNIIILWDVPSGREIKTFKGHKAGIIALAFLKDGKHIASADSDWNMMVWDIDTGKEALKYSIKYFPFKYNLDGFVRFSGDGTYALVADTSGAKIKIIETITGREIRSFLSFSVIDRYGVSPIKNAVFSPDNGKIMVVFRCEIKLLDIASGKEIKSFKFDKEKIAEFETAVFIPDGKSILYHGTSDMGLIDVTSGQFASKLENAGCPIKKDFLISPDGRYALAAGLGLEGRIIMWDLLTGKKTKTFNHGVYVHALAFAPSGASFVSTGGHYTVGKNNKTAVLWNVYSGAEIRKFSGAINIIRCLDISSDGRRVLSASAKDINVWDMEGLRREKILRGHADTVNVVKFSPDGRFILSGSGKYDGVVDNSLRLWDISNGKDIRKFTGHTSGVVALSFSPDGKLALSGGSGSPDKTARLWDIVTGREIRRFDNNIFIDKKDSYGKIVKENAGGGIHFTAFSRDGEFAVINRIDYTDIYSPLIYYDLFDTATFSKRKELTAMRGFNTQATLSPDGNYILTAGYNLIDILTGDKRREYKSRGYVYSTAFSPDMNSFASACESGKIYVRETSSGDVTTEFEGHKGSVKSVLFTPDGKRILSAGVDGTIRIWDVNKGKEIAQMIGFSDGEWIVITADGYYNCSAKGDSHLNVRIGRNVYGIDQYRSVFYKPQIVEVALKSGSGQTALDSTDSPPDKPAVASMQKIEPPFIVIKSPEEGAKLSSETAQMSLFIEDRNQFIKKVTVFINGRLMAAGESRGINIQPTATGINIPEKRKTLEMKITLSLEKGENVIEVVAFNGFSEGRRSIRIYSEERAKEKKGQSLLPNLWILSIGINNYQDKKISPLTYAAADAEGIVKSFETQKGKLFKEVNSMIISDAGLIKPTYDNIIDNLNYLSKAGQKDIVLLFIAGHGINDERGEFYFLPSDALIANDGSIKRSKAISWRELKSVLDLPAKKIIFADTCHSEGMSGKKTRGVDNDRFVKELQEANAVIFTSSRGKELSQESEKWKHGAFTYALLEGIKGKADLVKDGKISMKELDAYVSETVPQITGGAQHPITNTPDGYVNFPVAIVE